MPTRKIADLPKRCRHPEHNPPSHMVFEPGVYEHECPACGSKQTFRVDNPHLSVSKCNKEVHVNWEGLRRFIGWKDSIESLKKRRLP